MSTLYHETAWIQDAQPAVYTSVETDNYVSLRPEFSSKHVVHNAFSGPLDRSTRQQHMDQTTIFMSATTDSADEISSWWDIVGTDGDWRSGTEGIGSDSTVGTNGHCTSPESEGSWMSSSTDVAAQPTLLWNPAPRPQTHSEVGIYPEQVLAPQIPGTDSFSQDGYRIRKNESPTAGPLQFVKPDTGAIGGLPTVTAPAHFPAPPTGTNALNPKKPPARSKRGSAASRARAVVHPAQVRYEASAGGSSAAQLPPKHLASDGTCCPFCKAAFAGGEAGAIPIQEQGTSVAQVSDSKVGEEIRRRCCRNRKDARQHNRQGKWCASLALALSPLIFSCKSEKSLCGIGGAPSATTGRRTVNAARRYSATTSFGR